MGLQDDLVKNIADQAARYEAEKKKEPAKKPGDVGYREVEKINPDGTPGEKQLVDKHTGFHTLESTEAILGKRKNVSRLTRGVAYDKDGHPIALGGAHSGESGLQKL